MKSFLLIIVSILSGGLLSAQNTDFFIKSGSKGLFLEHKVSSKENFFSIGRLYNAHPRNIARFNGMEMSKSLSLGQVLQIPLTDTNLNRITGSGVPLYYTTTLNETVESIGKTFRLLPGTLRNWNEMTSNEVSPGKKLIVGFLITKEFSSLAVNLSSRSTDEKLNVHEPKPKTVNKDNNKEITVINREEPKKTEPILVRNDGKTGIGFFKTDFDKQVRRYPLTKEQMVTAGIFKTTSGWQDGKYYLLIDKVEPGTIVLITNPINNKIVYAKVLYGMEGIRQNEGLDIRISNAAASALDITDTDKFFIKVNY